MNSTEKEISYTSTNSYTTLNKLTKETKNVWLVCHGLGYLSQYFINYFKNLNTTENYIIAFQAPNKYYQDKTFKHVGACWFTKNNTQTEINNVCSYIDAVLAEENIPRDKNLVLFGYSQGVSVALRYLAYAKLKCKKIFIQSGGIPKELVPDDFNFLDAMVHHVYGKQDEYLNDERIAYEKDRAETLFGKHLKITAFEGKHVVNTSFIREIALSLQ